MQLFLSFLRNKTLREKRISNIHRVYFEVFDKLVVCMHHFMNKPEVGNSVKILVHSPTDKALVIGAGVTVHEALLTAVEVEKIGVNIRVLDPFIIKPIDAAAIIKHAKECGGKIVTVEDHYPEGSSMKIGTILVGLSKNVWGHEMFRLKRNKC